MIKDCDVVRKVFFSGSPLQRIQARIGGRIVTLEGATFVEEAKPPKEQRRKIELRIQIPIQSIVLFLPSGNSICYYVGTTASGSDIKVDEILVYSDGLVQVSGKTKSNKEKIYSYKGIPWEIEQYMEET